MPEGGLLGLKRCRLQNVQLDTTEIRDWTKANVKLEHLVLDGVEFVGACQVKNCRVDFQNIHGQGSWKFECNDLSKSPEVDELRRYLGCNGDSRLDNQRLLEDNGTKSHD